MKFKESIWGILVFVVTIQPVTAQYLHNSTACTSAELYLQSLHSHYGGRFFYHEDNPGSPHSEAIIEFWRDGELLWDAEVTRSCSQGVGRCWLNVPYLVDGVPSGTIKSEWNEVTLSDGQRLVVFSHLRDKITYLYFKSMPFSDIALQGNSHNGTEYPRREKMELPTAFISVDCTP